MDSKATTVKCLSCHFVFGDDKVEKAPLDESDIKNLKKFGDIYDKFGK